MALVAFAAACYLRKPAAFVPGPLRLHAAPLQGRAMSDVVGTRKPRVAGVDLQDADVARVLGEHTKVTELTVALFTPYGKSRAQGPDWPALWKQRHILGDIIALTGGNLLRLVKWEQQVATFAAANGKTFTADEISLIASRIRVMLSHLWRAKANAAKSTAPVIPKKYAPLSAIVNAMNTTKGGSSDNLADAPECIGDHEDNEPDVEEVVAVAEPPTKTLKHQVSDTSSDAVEIQAVVMEGDFDIDTDELYKQFFDTSKAL